MKKSVNFNLPVVILKEGEVFVAYTPALDISTVGETFEEAQKRFEELVAIFFEELLEAGTMKEVLLDLGWTKKDKKLVPPVVVANQIKEFTINKPISFAHA